MTNHRSLLGLVQADLDAMTPRLRRFVERTFPYNLTWTYVPGKENVIPDYLSRMTTLPPTSMEVYEALSFTGEDSRFTRLLLGGGPFYEELAAASLRDPVLAYIRERISAGWPRRCPSHVPGVTRYWALRDRLRTSGPFVLLQDDRVCVPSILVPRALELLHQGHPGVVGMRYKARRVLYWPGWSRDVATTVAGCIPCSASAPAPPRLQFFAETPPEFPGDQVAADHFDFGHEKYLVLVDIFSGFLFLHPCRTATSASVLTALQSVFLQTGLPRVFLSDGGLAFTSAQVQEFLTACGVRHQCSTPQFPQSNGAAERAVQTLKTLRAKCSSPKDLFAALLEFQNTPCGLCHRSPAEVFLGRSQRTWSMPCPRPATCSWSQLHACMKQNQADRQRAAPRSIRVQSFPPGQCALLTDFFGKAVPVQIMGPGAAPRAYKVKLPSGMVTERNTRFLSLLPRLQMSTTTQDNRQALGQPVSPGTAVTRPKLQTTAATRPQVNSSAVSTPGVPSPSSPTQVSPSMPVVQPPLVTLHGPTTVPSAPVIYPPLQARPQSVPVLPPPVLPPRPAVTATTAPVPPHMPQPGLPAVANNASAALAVPAAGNANIPGNVPTQRPQQTIRLTTKATESAAQGSLNPTAIYRNREISLPTSDTNTRPTMTVITASPRTSWTRCPPPAALPMKPRLAWQKPSWTSPTGSRPTFRRRLDTRTIYLPRRCA